mmetsp:Transcript_31532/g.51147  ORF Transcript_31532/g.51147 Transcript_31532/m.51147 type:complete len:82 (-) Transcript_31532:1821-2066(-)
MRLYHLFTKILWTAGVYSVTCRRITKHMKHPRQHPVLLQQTASPSCSRCEVERRTALHDTVLLVWVHGSALDCRTVAHHGR